MNYLHYTNLLYEFISNFSCGLPWTIPRMFFEKKRTKQFCFDFVNIGPYGCENFKNDTPPSIGFELFQTLSLNFLSAALTKVFSWIFEILRDYGLMIFFVFLNIGPYGSESFKCYSFKSHLICCNLFLDFLLSGHIKLLFCIFEIFSFRF